ncbi:MAG: nucleotidyltransferase domain-containing protein [Nanoarchaeota archaeon]|nr:nucleotidyltransferase domain-containing protein [Nanoarchaeota archaeon]
MEHKTKRNNRKLKIKEIVGTLKDNKKEIKMYSVDKLGVFGSYIKGNQSKDSDIDFLVRFENTNFDNYIGLKLFLEKLFKKKVDLVVERNLKSDFKYVKKEAIYV